MKKSVPRSGTPAVVEGSRSLRYAALRRRFLERAWVLWDAQLERDIAAGKLDFLREEALAAKATGNLIYQGMKRNPNDRR